jgi:hypothetical protein
LVKYKKEAAIVRRIVREYSSDSVSRLLATVYLTSQQQQRNETFDKTSICYIPAAVAAVGSRNLFSLSSLLINQTRRIQREKKRKKIMGGGKSTEKFNKDNLQVEPPRCRHYARNVSLSLSSHPLLAHTHT